MSSILKTLVGGAIGLAVLYLAGKIGYEIGKEDDEVDKADDVSFSVTSDSEESNDGGCERQEQRPEKKVGKIGMLLRLGKLIQGKGKSIVESIITDPDNCKAEMYVKEGVVHISVYKRRE